MKEPERKPPRSRRHYVGESRGSCPPNWFKPGEEVFVVAPLQGQIDDLPGRYNAPESSPPSDTRRT